MKIQKSELLKVLKQCLPGVEQGVPKVTGADTFVLRGGKVYTYNGEISVTVSMPESLRSLEGAFRAQELFDLVNKIKDPEIELGLSEKSLKIESGKISAELAKLDDVVMSRVSDMPMGDEWTRLPDGFFEALSRCVLPMNKLRISGVCVRDGVMLSTDNVRINCNHVDGMEGTFWISDAAVSELVKFDGLSFFQIVEGWVHFTKDSSDESDESIFSVYRLMDAEWPFDNLYKTVQDHQQDENDFSHSFPKELISAVGRASSLSSEISNFDSVRMDISPKGINVSSERATGKYAELVEWEESPERDFEPITVYVGVGNMIQALKKTLDFYIKDTPSRHYKGEIVRRIVLHHDDFSHIMTTLNPKNK